MQQRHHRRGTASSSLIVLGILLLGAYSSAGRSSPVPTRPPRRPGRIRPDQGHIHLLVDGKLVAMNYGLNERLPALAPGQHLVQVELSPPTTPPSTREYSPKPPSP